jgi:hypothetical protein
MTEQLDDSDDYPDAWKPRERVELDEALEPLAVEAWLASLSAVEFAQLVARARGGAGR